MVDFVKAYNITMGHEGGYANDPDDRGGETYKGVARVANPNWDGWAMIDKAKDSGMFPDNLDEISELQMAVKMVYREKYWDKNKLGEFKNQELANKMFDVGVNMGVGKAAMFFQESLNLLNRNEKDYNDIAVDGGIGPVTMKAYGSVRHTDNLLTSIKGLQFERYRSIVERNPVQEKYFNGWMKRI